MMTLMWRAGLVILLAGCALGCAKDPFSLRVPETPIEQEGRYVTPVDPLIALDNLLFAMTEQNLGHYIQIFSDSLSYTFDYLTVDRPDSARGWGYAEDSRIASNLFSGVDSMTLDWELTPARTDRFEDSTAILYRTYTLTTFDLGDSVRAEVFVGEMTVFLERNTLDLWWILRWEDSHTTPGVPSWADLKSQYR